MHPGLFTDLPTWILSSAATRSHQILHRRLADAGTTGYEYRCLSVLSDGGLLSQTEVGRAAALDPRDVTHTLRGLEDRGLVVRHKDPDHGRRVIVDLTTAGRKAHARIAAAVQEAQEEVFGALGADERRRLLALLTRVG